MANQLSHYTACKLYGCSPHYIKKTRGDGVSVPAGKVFQQPAEGTRALDTSLHRGWAEEEPGTLGE